MRLFTILILLAICISAKAQKSGTQNHSSLKDTLNLRTDPMYILDGKIILKDSLQLIDMTKIESIEVLKDSTRTAMYGPGGRYGVILIHTKKSGFKRNKDQE